MAAAWAGDVSGDGRADLILRQHPDEGGVRIKTAITGSPLPPAPDRMANLLARYETALDPARRGPSPGDGDRDGREDVWLLKVSGGRPAVERLRGQSPGGLPGPCSCGPRRDRSCRRGKTRLGAADVDYDGMTDLVLFSSDPSGTRIRMLMAATDRAIRTRFHQGLDWVSLRPY